MKPPSSCTYYYAAPTVDAASTLTEGTVSETRHRRGMRYGEPLIIAMDALYRYADAYRARFEAPLSEDYALGPPWLDAARGIRLLCNGDGAEAMDDARYGDSKDNGCIETVFWAAMAAAGFSEKDMR